LISTSVNVESNVSGKTLSAVFDDFIVMIDYSSGEVTVLPSEEAHLVDSRPLYSFLTGKLDELRLYCDRPAFRLHYGPLSSGIWEAGAFEVVSYGERILNVVPLCHYKRLGDGGRELIKVEGKEPEVALMEVERICGTFSASYSTAFTMAVERIAGVEVDSNVKAARIAAVELERIYNHVHAIYRVAVAASQKVAVSHLLALEEDVLRLNFRLFGHRYAFGFNRIGGVRLRDVKALSKLDAIEREFDELVEELSVSKIFIDRLHNTAKLSAEEIAELDAIGIAAKGSGVDRDVRKFSENYPGFKPVVKTDGDSLARILVRVDEVKQSISIIRECEGELRAGGVKNGWDGWNAVEGEAMAFVESPPGDLLMYVKLSGGRVEKFRVRGASAINYLAFARGVEGNIFTDYPFALESFGLSFADAQGLL